MLPSLPNNHSLSISQTVAKNIFGNALASHPSECEEQQRQKIYNLLWTLETVDHLDLTSFDVKTAARMVNFTQGHIRSIRLSGNSYPTLDMSPLISKLTEMRELRVLEIEQDEQELQLDPATWTPDAFAAIHNNPPPLSTLHLNFFELNESYLRFMDLFSTVQNLHLRFESLETAVILAWPTPLNLPNLVSLHLHRTNRADEAVNLASVLLLAFRKSPLAFVSITDDVGLPIDSLHGGILHTLATHFPTLRRVELAKPQEGLTLQDTQEIHKFCAERRIATPAMAVFDRPVDLSEPSLNADLDGMEESHLDGVCDELESLLQFGMREVARLRDGRDVGGTRALVESLRGLNNRRTDWMD
ncbi:hypothetical protein P7C70_g8776, partial [Phenoliferia sp. Uapishka_3]